MLKVPRLPCGFALKAAALPFSLALKAQDLPAIPGHETVNGTGPVLLTQTSQRRHRDDADDRPLIEPAAPQHANQHSQPDQPQRRPMIST